MDSVFWSKLALSFVLGGAWVAVSTVLAERLGSKIGGLIGGFPSTAVVALFFIGLTQSPKAAAEATTIIPLAQGCNGLLVLAFLILARFGLAAALAGSLMTWTVLAGGLVALQVRNLSLSLAGWIALTVACYFLAEKILRVPSRFGHRVHHTLPQTAIRAAFGGTIIAFAVFMAKAAGSFFGGIFATFPAVFLSTLVITYHTEGFEFARAVGKSLIIGGLVNVGVYALSVRIAYPRLGLWMGTGAALFIALGTAAATFVFLKKRVS